MLSVLGFRILVQKRIQVLLARWSSPWRNKADHRKDHQLKWSILGVRFRFVHRFHWQILDPTKVAYLWQDTLRHTLDWLNRLFCLIHGLNEERLKNSDRSLRKVDWLEMVCVFVSMDQWIAWLFQNQSHRVSFCFDLCQELNSLV